MTQEDKELLLKDLCTRLPYDVQGITSEGVVSPLLTRGEADWDILTSLNYRIVKYGWKPYLRPMSSMTEEEYEEFCKTDKLMATLLEINKLGIQGTRECHLMVAKALGERVTEQQKWLNTYHFDYRGLIEKGLAIEAPEDMYDTKN